MPNRVIFAFYASHSLLSAIFLSRLHFNPHIYANNDAAWTVSATLCVNVFFVCTCRQLRNIKTNRENDILFAFPVAQLFEQKQFRNDIHMQRKIPKLKATKVTAQWNHTDFERDWSEKRSTRPANQLARTHTQKKGKQTNWAAYFFLSQKPKFNSCAPSLSQKNIYMLNYDLTLLFKQFILMLVVAMVQSYSLSGVFLLHHLLLLFHFLSIKVNKKNTPSLRC